MPNSEQIQIGDLVCYYGRSGHVCHGYVAERANSPLTGNPRFRVVDALTDIDDPEAGIWRDLEGDLISADGAIPIQHRFVRFPREDYHAQQ